MAAKVIKLIGLENNVNKMVVGVSIFFDLK